MSRFMDAFGQDAYRSGNISAEVLNLLNSELPTNLMYFQDNDGRYMVIPRPENLGDELKLTTQLDLPDHLRERVKLISPENWWKYFYRLQQPIPIKNIKIGNSDKLIPVEETLGSPLQDSDVIISDAQMYPQKLPNPIVFDFESEEGTKISTAFQQQPYDNIAEIKLQNIDFPALKIEIYYFDPLADDVSNEKSHTNELNKVDLVFSVFPTKANNVKEAVDALELFKSLSNGTAKINGRKLFQKEATITLTPGQIDEALNFWSALRELEKKLQVKFVPSAPFPAEDVQLFKELCVTLIDKKELTWKHPFDHFHIGGYTPVDEESTLEKLVGKEKIAYKFKEGPIAASLLGAEFNLYSESSLKGFVITNIAWDDEQKKGCEVYIADAPEDVITLSRLYITEKEYSEQSLK